MKSKIILNNKLDLNQIDSNILIDALKYYNRSDTKSAYSRYIAKNLLHLLEVNKKSQVEKKFTLDEINFFCPLCDGNVDYTDQEYSMYNYTCSNCGHEFD